MRKALGYGIIAIGVLIAAVLLAPIPGHESPSHPALVGLAFPLLLVTCGLYFLGAFGSRRSVAENQSPSRDTASSATSAALAAAEPEITVQYVYTQAEAVRATVELTKVILPFSHLAPLLGAALVVVGVTGRLFALEPITLSPIWIALGAFLAVSPVLVRLEAKRNFRKNPSAGQTITWKIGSTRLANGTEHSTASFAWHVLVRIRECHDGFLLFPHPKIAHWIPKSAFGSAVDLLRFRELAKMSGVALR